MFLIIFVLFGGIIVDNEFEKFLELIVGDGILEFLKKISMEDYLIILKEFKFKLLVEVFNLRVRIKVLF